MAVIPMAGPNRLAGLDFEGSTLSVDDLIRIATETPTKPIIPNLWNENGIMLIHAPEGSYKSMLVMQLADALASGTTFCRRWPIKEAFSVGVVQTEMDDHQLGLRLNSMYSSYHQRPKTLHTLSRSVMQAFKRAATPNDKLAIIDAWIRDRGIEVMIVDPANDFFRGEANPNSEVHVAAFFDGIRALPLRGTCMVRHDHKPKMEDNLSSNTNDRIRGSAEWKEDPETILYIEHADKRTSEVILHVGKLRYCEKPDALTLWFDSAPGQFRLTPLPPVIALLEHGPQPRSALVNFAEVRFRMKQRAFDNHVKEHKSFLNEFYNGHQKSFEINVLHMKHSGEELPEWATFLTKT